MKNLRQGVVVAAATATMVTIGTFAVVGASSTTSRAVASGSSIDGGPTPSLEGNGPLAQLPDTPLEAVDPDLGEPVGSIEPNAPSGSIDPDMSTEPPVMSEPSDSLAPDASDLPIGSEPADTFPGETDGSEPGDPGAGVVPPGPVIDHVVIASYVHTIAAAGSFAWDVGGGPVGADAPVSPPSAADPIAYVNVDGSLLVDSGGQQTVTDFADGAAVAGGASAELTALGGTDAAYITVALTGTADTASVVGEPVTLEAATYDVDVNIDHVQPGDLTLVESTGVGTTLYVVLAGTVQLGDGTSASAGARATTTDDLTFNSNVDATATVLTATITTVTGVPETTAVATTATPETTPTTTAAVTETDTPVPTTVPACDPNADDPDGDGLSSAIEIADGSDPCDPDSDDDGLNDYDEYHLYVGNPNSADTDGDGLGDYDEAIVHETQLNNPDTDFDGVSDAVEVAAGTDPNDPNDN